MPSVTVAWEPNPIPEQITVYHVFRDGILLGGVTSPSFTEELSPGVYVYEIAAVGGWGEGPKSDPVPTPIPASKVSGVHITINVSASVSIGG